MEQYLADLEAGEASVSAYYGLTTQGYENLSNNIADLKRYLSQLKSIVKYYREIDEKEEWVGEFWGRFCACYGKLVPVLNVSYWFY